MRERKAERTKARKKDKKTERKTKRQKAKLGRICESLRFEI